MKKIIIVLIIMLGIFTVGSAKTYADTGEASIRGFDITDFTYVDDEPNEILELYGSKFYYGDINMWTGIYKFYNYTENKMFYAVLIEAMIDASSEKTASHSFSAKQIKLNVNFSSSYGRLVSYSPQPQPGTYEITTSFGTTYTYDSGSGGYYIEPTITYSLSQAFNEINQIIQEGNRSVIMEFNFSRYADNVRGIPYQGAYRQRAIVYFAIDNYSTNQNYLTNSQIVINYYGSIFKDGAWFESNYTNVGLMNDTYHYTSNGNYN